MWIQTLVCSSCGANAFDKYKSQYICKYCGSTKIIHKYQYKKILFILLLITIGITLLNYKKLFVMEEKIQNISQKNIKSNTIEVSDENPFSALIQRVEETIDSPIPVDSLESVLEYYNTLENPKAFSIAYNDTGAYVYAFSRGDSIKEAKEKSLLQCDLSKRSEKRITKSEKCLIYFLNDRFVWEEGG